MLWSELEEEDVLWDEALDGIVVRVERVCLDVLSAGVLKRVYLGLMGPGNTIASTVQVSRGGVLIHPAETGRNVELEGSPWEARRAAAIFKFLEKEVGFPGGSIGLRRGREGGSGERASLRRETHETWKILEAILRMREDGELALEVSPPGERGDRGQPATSAPHTVFVSQAGNLWLLLREDDHEEPTMLNLETGEVRAFSRVAYLLTWGWREL